MGTNTESIRVIRINISEEHKAFLWTPPKTASEHATMVFSLFGFESYLCDYDRKIVHEYQPVASHHHNLSVFQGHENYKLICTARNPLKALFSAYLFSNMREKNYSIQGFRDFFRQEFDKGFSFWLMSCKNTLRTPDYYVRQESMFEDYLNIPFIRESKIAQCGVLEEVCRKKVNFSPPHNLDIRECYTSDMIDSVYYEFRWYFDKLGYDTNL